jgi:sec-independent protein translocase protein TatB
MFDIGFSELLVCAVVALVVIGPERLPKVARTLGVLFGRLQRYVTQVKADINREMEMADLGQVKAEFENAARSFQSDVESHAAQAESAVRDMQSSVAGDLEAATSGVGAAAAAAEPAPSPPQLELGIEEPTALRADPAKPST